MKVYEGKATNGLPIVIKRMKTLGHLCGYVGVPCEHPWYRIVYSQCVNEGTDDTPESLIDVHGGLTFSSMGDRDLFPADYWWFGFDCAHFMDKTSFNPSGIERDETWVKEECGRLAEQLGKVVVSREVTK